MASIAAPIEINIKVAEFLKHPKKLLIGGAWMEAASGKTFDTYNPATGEVLAKIAEGDRFDIDLAVKAARKAFEEGPWPGMLPAERARLLWKLADLIDEHREDLAELETLDNGKPVLFSRIVDVPTAASNFRYMAGWATKIEGKTIPISMPGAVFRVHLARARWSRGTDYSLELPAHHGVVEARPRTRRWLHGSAEARRTNSAHRTAPW